MKYLFLILAIFFTMLSCGETEAIDKCQDINCSGFGSCKILNEEASCICETGYTNGENQLECIENTLECATTEHEELGKCVNNRKMVDCIDVTPDNATTSNIKTEIIWENGSWSEADNCEWTCKDNYIKESNLCIEDLCDFYVSTLGNDDNNGLTREKPFLTLEKARDTIRNIKTSEGLPENGLTVCLRKGVYKRKDSFELNSEDSGEEGKYITYMAYNNENVRIIGGEKIDTSWFSLVTDSSGIWDRLDESAKGKLLSVNLIEHNITDFGTLRERGFTSPKIAALELFFNEKVMTLSRWPDKDENEVIIQTPKDTSIIIYGETIPEIKGNYEVYETIDGVNSYKRTELLNGLQYYLYRHTWEYPSDSGDWYTAWFITTDYDRYPSDENPWFSRYNESFGEFSPHNATGKPTTIRNDAINHGYAIIKEAIDDTRFSYYGDRPSRWLKAEDLWFHGFWKYAWADLHIKSESVNTDDKIISLAHKPGYGIESGLYFYAENLLEEITQPDEWYLNRETGILYFWPNSDINNSEIIISMLEEPLVKLTDSSYIKFDGIIFEMSRANLIEIKGSNNLISNSIFRNTGNTGVILNGYDNKIEYCEVYDNGDSGIRIEGGTRDRASLTRANNIIENTIIHNISRWSSTYNPAISIKRGVGNIIRHNSIYDIPHTAILFAGNEHIIEYNDIHDTNKFSSDAGAIYTGRDWGWRGNIIRYNFIHNVYTYFSGYGAHGVYLDDIVSGIHVYSNIFYKIQDYGIMTGGGRDNIIEKNILVKTKGFHTDCRGTRALNNTPGDSFNLLERLTWDNVDYKAEPWLSKYPLLALIPNSWDTIVSEFYSDDFYNDSSQKYSKWFYPDGTIFSRNIAYENQNFIHDGCSTVSYKKSFSEVIDNMNEVDPLFVDEDNLNLNLEDNSPAFSISGFENIDFDKIGVIER